MKRISKYLVISLLLVGNLFSCSKDAISKYSVIEISGQWTNFNNGQIITINSQNELENHYADTNYPDIDFSKHTLLLASGTTNNGISEKNAKQLLQHSKAKYELNVEITLNETTIVEEWTLALLTNKLDKECNIELRVITKH